MEATDSSKTYASIYDTTWHYLPSANHRILSSAQCTLFNPLKPNDLYIGRNAQLTSRRCILYIYSTNIHTEYFKHAA